MGGTATADRLPSASAVAALVRVPNLFTAPPDVVLGAAVAAGAGSSVAPEEVAGLAVASVFLYAGGTTLNDAFDADADAVERPERPIPSGEVSRRTAFDLGALFLLFGVVGAAIATGVAGGLVAALTAGGILLYDGALKGGAVGFATMGAVRGLNVVLGTTVAGIALPAGRYLPAVVVAAYIAAVTFMAAHETVGGNRSAVVVAATGAAAAVVAVGVYHVLFGPRIAATAIGGVLAVGFASWTGSALRTAYADPTPENVGPAVGTCVLALVVLDAAFAAATSAVWAVVAVAFLVPAVGLARAFDVT